ncbi:MAG: hypothetical protein ACKVOE_04580 [Rickettsiales bacterium]
MASQICTHCGYEGKAVNPPSDATPEAQSETGKAFDRICRVIFALTFIPVKPIAQAIAAPFYVLIWLVRSIFHISNKRHCPNCGLPLMVSLKSDAGWLAKRKQEVKAGVVKFEEKKEVVAFGREVKLPEPEQPAVDFEAPFDEFEAPIATLPSVDKILAEVAPDPAELAVSELVPEPAAPAAMQQKKIDPEAW